jgi:hypothetical protein
MEEMQPPKRQLSKGIPQDMMVHLETESTTPQFSEELPMTTRRLNKMMKMGWTFEPEW